MQVNDGSRCPKHAGDILRSITRERFHNIWESVKAGNTAELNSEEQKLAQIMLQHREEYHNHNYMMFDLAINL